MYKTLIYITAFSMLKPFPELKKSNKDMEKNMYPAQYYTKPTYH